MKIEEKKMVNRFSGMVEILDGAGKATITLDGDSGKISTGGSGHNGKIWVRNEADKVAFHLFRLGNLARLSIGGGGIDGQIVLKNTTGDPIFVINGRNGDMIARHKFGNDLRVALRFDASRATFFIGSKDNAGDIFLKDAAGKNRIHLDGNTGDIQLMGADCAEEFDVSESEEIEPGTVLVIDDLGKLRPCEKPYDKKVAGVVSGGDGSNPGIILDKKHAQNKRLPIALNGKVYCKIDTRYSPIEVGDLLTTSPTTGHAMKADNPLEAFGAVIGKALGSLREGTGIIPILVALQ